MSRLTDLLRERIKARQEAVEAKEETKQKLPTVELTFDGETFDQRLDGKRLTTQFFKVRAVMLDGQRHTVKEVYEKAKLNNTSGITARIRDLRKSKFGGWLVLKMRKKGERGVWLYRLVLDPATDVPHPDEVEYEIKKKKT